MDVEAVEVLYSRLTPACVVREHLDAETRECRYMSAVYRPEHRDRVMPLVEMVMLRNGFDPSGLRITDKSPIDVEYVKTYTRLRCAQSGCSKAANRVSMNLDNVSYTCAEHSPYYAESWVMTKNTLTFNIARYGEGILDKMSIK